VRRFATIFVVVTLSAAVLAGQRSSADVRETQSARRQIPSAERVDLNHATLNDLLKVQGLTRTWAERIVRFRPYRTRLDLLQEGILPPDVYNRIKDAVIVHREKK
jgi:competence protein ComEA